eukprot:gene12469-biopygen3441
MIHRIAEQNNHPLRPRHPGLATGCCDTTLATLWTSCFAPKPL